MSGFDEKTGWCHFTPKKWRRYYREIDTESNLIEDRFEKRNIPFYFDKTDGLNAKCTDGEMWTILSGRESQWSAKMPPEPKLFPKYVNATIIGQKLNPVFSPIKVNKLLEKFGYQKKVNGAWHQTEKGTPLSNNATSSYDDKPFLTWAWDIIKVLQKHIDDTT